MQYTITIYDYLLFTCKGGDALSERDKENVTREPHYYEKLLLQKPNDPYILYALAFKYEFQANELKDVDEATYKRKLKQALHYFQLALDNGYNEAVRDIERTKQHLRSDNAIPSNLSNFRKPIQKRYLLLLLLLCLALFALLVFANKDKILGKFLDNKYEEVVYSISEPSLDELNNHISVSYNFSSDTSVAEIEKHLVQKLKNLRTSNTHSSFELIVFQNKGELTKETMKLFSKPNAAISSIVQTEKTFTPTPTDEDSLSLVVLRSALYHYVMEHKTFPSNLQILAKDFPRNYISGIPFDSLHFKNQVKNEFDNSGGWVYEPPPVYTVDSFSTSSLRSVVEQSVKPNFEHSCKEACDFYPLELRIDKSTHLLEVTNGSGTFGYFNVGLGKNNSTPEGLFSIQKRVAFPNSHLHEREQFFGTRGLELSNPKFAIHGTEIDSSIGKNKSMGCVRLTNGDVERLFELTPLGTTVTIINSESISSNSTKDEDIQKPNPPSKNGPPFGEVKGTPGEGSGNPGDGKGHGPPNEKDPETIYNWSR